MVRRRIGRHRKGSHTSRCNSTDTVREASHKLIERPSRDPARTEYVGPYVLESLIDRAEERAGTVYRVEIAAQQRTCLSYYQVADEYYLNP